MIPNREPDGTFTSFESWCCHAPSWIGGTNALCADEKDRILKNGADFQRAKQDGSFPVRYWHGEGSLTKKEQQKSRKNHRETMKMLYPWRY